MSYLTFLLVFIVPPILWLALVPRKRSTRVRQFGISLVLMCGIAFVYTTPWDNYLVASEIWGYPADRIFARMGHVPVEEYAFFILQPILTGLWLLRLLPRFEDQLFAEGHYTDRDRASRFWGAALAIFLTYFGAALLTVTWGTYLGLILIWACPVLAFQWIYGGHDLWRLRNLWIAGWLPPTIYLWIADRFAISQGIWFFSEYKLSGLALLGLPLEEAMFFLVTNLMVVQGLVLYQVTLNKATVSGKPPAWLKLFPLPLGRSR